MKSVFSRGNSASATPLGPATVPKLENVPVDSPVFEQEVKHAYEWSIEASNRVKKVAKQFSVMQALENEAAESRKQLLVSLEELLEEMLGTESETAKKLSGVKDLLKMLIDMETEQVEREKNAGEAIEKRLMEYISADVQEACESYKVYQKSSALNVATASKVSKVSKDSSKAAELEHSAEDARKEHEHNASLAITSLSNVIFRLPLEIAEAAIGLFNAESEFITGVSNKFRSSSTKISNAKSSTEALRRKANSAKPLAVCPSLSSSAAGVGGSNGENGKDSRKTKRYTIEGYLFKRASNLTKGWQRRYFVIKNDQLSYTKEASGDSDSVEPSPGSVVDIILTTVKPRDDLDRRFCFEVISPQRNFLLQADSQAVMNEWLSVFENVRERCLESASLNGMAGGDGGDGYSKASSGGNKDGNNKKDTKEMAAVLWSLDPSNRVCCDCGAPNPDWVSINLGLLCCINCSGIHRSLGVNYSKVRSFKLDSLDEDVLALIARLGNKFVNNIFEAKIPSDRKKPTPDAKEDVRTAWIRDKYINRAFVAQSTMSQQQHTDKFRAACENDNLEQMLLHLAQGADINHAFGPDGETCLHIALRKHKIVACQFLILNGADTCVQTRKGASPLHYCASFHFPEIVNALVRAGADATAQDMNGKTPAMLATSTSGAILKLAQAMREGTDPQEKSECSNMLQAMDRELKEKKFGASLADALKKEYAKGHTPGGSASTPASGPRGGGSLPKTFGTQSKPAAPAATPVKHTPGRSFGGTSSAPAPGSPLARPPASSKPPAVSSSASARVLPPVSVPVKSGTTSGPTRLPAPLSPAAMAPFTQPSQSQQAMVATPLVKAKSFNVGSSKSSGTASYRH